MNEKRDNRWFWNRYAKLYDWEINRFSGKAYAEMYRLMASVLSPNMVVLEVATGTGLIAVNIAPYVKYIEATDYAPKMIETAKKKKTPGNLCFSVGDATALPFENDAFDAVIISNALHVMPAPETALAEISRLLKPNGLLIAPNYSHGHIKESTWNMNVKFLRAIGFESHSKWTPEEYVEFIGKHGFQVEKWKVMKAAFPLVYLEAKNAASKQGCS